MVCRTNGVSDQWCVGPMVCRTNGVSDHWCVGPMVCRTIGVSDQWCVGPMTCNPEDSIRHMLAPPPIVGVSVKGTRKNVKNRPPHVYGLIANQECCIHLTKDILVSLI